MSFFRLETLYVCVAAERPLLAQDISGFTSRTAAPRTLPSRTR